MQPDTRKLLTTGTLTLLLALIKIIGDRSR